MKKKAFIGDSGRSTNAVMDHTAEREPKYLADRSTMIGVSLTDNQVKILPDSQRCRVGDMPDCPRQEPIDHGAESSEHNCISWRLFRLFIEAGDDETNRWDDDCFKVA